MLVKKNTVIKWTQGADREVRMYDAMSLTCALNELVGWSFLNHEWIKIKLN